MAAQASRIAVGGWSVSLYTVFDELLCVVTRSSGGLEDKWDQIAAGVRVEFVSSSRLAM